MKDVDEHDPIDESRPLADLLRIAGGTCTDCRRAYTAREAVGSIALGFRNAARCWNCLGLRLDRDSVELERQIDDYVQRRECYRRAWQAADAMDRETVPDRTVAEDPSGEMTLESSETEWDAGDLGCGELVMMLRLKLKALPAGTEFRLRATDPGAPEDIPAWCRLCGHTLISMDHPDYTIRRKGD